MHFRERGKIIQVIRTTYDASKQRGKPDIVARLDKESPKVTDEIRSNCSVEEVQEIESWIAQRGTRDSIKREYAVHTLLEQLSEVTAWFAGRTPAPETQALASELIPALQKLQRQLRKNGFVTAAATETGKGKQRKGMGEGKRRRQDAEPASV